MSEVGDHRKGAQLLTFLFNILPMLQRSTADCHVVTVVSGHHGIQLSRVYGISLWLLAWVFAIEW